MGAVVCLGNVFFDWCLQVSAGVRGWGRQRGAAVGAPVVGSLACWEEARQGEISGIAFGTDLLGVIEWLGAFDLLVLIFGWNGEGRDGCRGSRVGVC